MVLEELECLVKDQIHGAEPTPWDRISRMCVQYGRLTLVGMSVAIGRACHRAAERQMNISRSKSKHSSHLFNLPFSVNWSNGIYICIISSDVTMRSHSETTRPPPASERGLGFRALWGVVFDTFSGF